MSSAFSAFSNSVTIAVSEKPGLVFIVIVTARSRLCRVIFEIALPEPRRVASDRGRWPGAFHATETRSSAGGAQRDVRQDLVADLLHRLVLAALALLGIAQVDVDVADVGLAAVAVGDRHQGRVDLGQPEGLARQALGDHRGGLERGALAGLKI